MPTTPLGENPASYWSNTDVIATTVRNKIKSAITEEVDGIYAERTEAKVKLQIEGSNRRHGPARQHWCIGQNQNGIHQFLEHGFDRAISTQGCERSHDGMAERSIEMGWVHERLYKADFTKLNFSSGRWPASLSRLWTQPVTNVTRDSFTLELGKLIGRTYEFSHPDWCRGQWRTPRVRVAARISDMERLGTGNDYS